MKFTQLISVILLSTTALTAASAFDEGDEAAVFATRFQHGGEVGYTLRQGRQTLVSVFYSSVVRAETDYTVCRTDNPLSHAFIPSSEGVFRQWVDGVDFLLETLNAGLEYSLSLIEEDPSEETRRIRAVNPRFLQNMLQQAMQIHNYLRLDRSGFLHEGLLNRLYLDIRSSIDEIQQCSNTLLQNLIHTMYVPIRDWMRAKFPISQMYDYVEPKVTNVKGQEKRVDYFFKPELYFNGYLFKTEAFNKIENFLAKKPTLHLAYNSSLENFVSSTCFELKSTETVDDELTVDSALMQYVRFLEGIKQREIVFIETWLSKLQAEETKNAELTAVRAAEIRLRTAEHKARKELDPKVIQAEMMRALGLEDSPADQPKHKKTKPKAEPSKKSLQRKPVVTEGVAPCLIEGTPPVAMAAGAASASPSSNEHERLARLAEVEAENATRNRGQKQRQEMLQERRAAAAESEERVRDVLVKRYDIWIENAFSARLASFDESQHLSLDELNLNPDFDTVCGKLRGIGCYVDTNIHGNEKCIARWIGADGKSAMIWFDRPHGAQLKMGVAAGWFKSLIKRLRETGKLV